jgi:hypothetical protein
MAFRIAFAEPEDPQTLWGWVQHWAQFPSELAVGSFPLLIPGAILGFTWSTGNQRSTSAA